MRQSTVPTSQQNFHGLKGASLDLKPFYLSIHLNLAGCGSILASWFVSLIHILYIFLFIRIIFTETAECIQGCPWSKAISLTQVLLHPRFLVERRVSLSQLTGAHGARWTPCHLAPLVPKLEVNKNLGHLGFYFPYYYKRKLKHGAKSMVQKR